MRISVVAVGTRMPAWVIQGIEEYSKRMPRELKSLWREIPLARRGKDTAGDQACVADNYSILIGGPDGLSPGCLARADQCWSLSDLTLPHPLVRVLLAEQLYRAWTITVNHPYHRA